MNIHRDGITSALDIIDTAFYLGVTILPSELTDLLMELNATAVTLLAQ